MEIIMDHICFGTGGWRAVIGDDFIRSNIEKVAQGVCGLILEERKQDLPVVLGYDRRFLSDKAMVWISQVLAGNGLKVQVMRRSTPTPLIMYMVKEKGLAYGLEVTASHNPSEFNGIKIIVEEGRDAPLELTNRLEKRIEGIKEEDIKSIPFDLALQKGLIEYLKNPFNGYIDAILEQVDTQAVREAGLRILFDPMHGSGAYPLQTILTTCRCTVDVIHQNKDAFFGGQNPAPGYLQLADLRNMVVSGNYDLGIALDGDGDRLGIIDSNGEYLNANKILVMLYYYLHEIKGWKGPVVRNLATTHMLDALAESFEEECYEVPVGFKWISSKMDEVDATLGGESSGGLTVRGHIHGKDSVYAATLFVEMVSKIGKPLSQYWRELEKRYGHYALAEDNLRFPAEMKEDLIAKNTQKRDLSFFTYLFGKEATDVSYLDGCKIRFGKAFLVCRFSGTEPLLRIFAEDTTMEEAKRMIVRYKSFLFSN